VLSINARTGDDTFRTTSTNFVPGFEYNRGIMIGGWTPRFNVSGPIKRGRAWFSNSADVQYVNTVIKELPRGQDQTTSWRFSNHVNTQVNLAPSNILYTGFLVNLFSAPLHGLSALDPPETTRDISRRQWFFHTKDQLYLTRDILVEAGYAANRTYGREMPQGNSIYQIMPDGMRGNFFVNSTQRASRDQFLVNTFLPTYTLAGEHRVKAGADLDRLTYWQDVRRTGYENFGQDCIRRRRTVFGGVGETALANSEASVYLHDSWRLRPNMLLELGGRGDWDRILHYWSVSPRAGVAWSPPRLSHTKLSGGYGMIYDATPLRVFMRPQDQHMLTTYYDPHGNVVRGPAVTAFTIQHFDPSRPRYRNYSLGWEQEWRPGVHTQVDFLRKRGNYGFTYVNILKPGGVAPPEWRERFRDLKFDSLYSLTNDRTDMFDSLRLTFRQVIRRKYEWMASYTRSRSLSNAVVDVNLDDPIVVDLNVGPMPWDSPNRFLTWGYLPTFREKWAVAYMLDWRTGFPFSIVSEDGRMAGRVNSFRLPDYFELNLHIERRFEFRKNIWAFRAGANNITNHSNPNLVNNNMSSTSFLRYYGGADRSFNVRLRWLGKLAQ
jgi:hypothetical protein